LIGLSVVHTTDVCGGRSAHWPTSVFRGGAPAEIELGVLSLQNMLSGDSSFDDFHKNQLAKVQLFKVDSHDNHKFMQYEQY